jgi:biotin operon repressor
MTSRNQARIDRRIAALGLLSDEYDRLVTAGAPDASFRHLAAKYAANGFRYLPRFLAARIREGIEAPNVTQNADCLTDVEQKILEVVTAHKEISSHDLAAAIGKGRNHINTHVRRLRESGLVVFQINRHGKGGWYSLPGQPAPNTP